MGHLAWELLLLLLLFFLVVCSHGDSDGQALPRLHRQRGCLVKQSRAAAAAGTPGKRSLCVVRVQLISVCMCARMWGRVLARGRVWAAILNKGHICVYALLRQPVVTEPNPLASGSSAIRQVCVCMCVKVCVSRRVTLRGETVALTMLPFFWRYQSPHTPPGQPLLQTHTCLFWLSHSIIIFLSLPRLWIFSASL